MQKQTGVVWGKNRIGNGFHHIMLLPLVSFDCPQQVLHLAPSCPLSFKWKLDIESKRVLNWGNGE